MEANWLMIVLLASGSSIAAYIGRVWFNRWFNPLSLYSALWGFCLCSYELRLIQYEPVSRLAWIYIILAWVSLYLGAASIFATQSFRGQPAARPFPVELFRLRKAIVVLSAIGGIGVADQIRAVASNFGNPFVAVFVNAGEIYLGRVSGELSWIPYAGALLFVGSSLAGVYTARVGRLTMLASVPLVLETISNILGMFRGGVVMAAFLFLVSYLYTPKPNRFKAKRWQKILALSLSVAILVSGFVFVSATRGLGVDFPGITPAMEKITESIPVFPSIYSNFSATPVALSMYLKSPEEDKTGHWGEFALWPLMRLLARLGLSKAEPLYEEVYYTPVPMNTGTYLKNIDSDFGISGIILFPYLLGTIMTALALRTRTDFRLLDVMVLANLYLIVVFSFVVNFMQQGSWYVSVAGSIVTGIVVKRGLTRTNPKAVSGVADFRAFGGSLP
jgi:oligosaccharide repeat unit polymerase